MTDSYGSKQKIRPLSAESSLVTTAKPKAKADCCKKVLKFSFSYVGLTVLLVLFTVGGGFLFKLLEEHEEIRNCQKGKGEERALSAEARQWLLSYVQFNVSVTQSANKDSDEKALLVIQDYIQQYAISVMNISSIFDYQVGKNCDTEFSWDLPNACLFAITVSTTIGYGHVSPNTWEGQIVCLCYATLGIPLFLLFLANISTALGSFFRFTYMQICCRVCYRKKLKRIKEMKEEGIELDEEETNVSIPLTVTMGIIVLYIFGGAALFDYWEDWGLIAAAYFCYITLSTIGFGDFVPGANTIDGKNVVLKLIVSVIYILVGMAILAMSFNLMQEEIVSKFQWIGQKCGLVKKDADDDEFPDSDDERKKNEKLDDSDEEENDDKYYADIAKKNTAAVNKGFEGEVRPKSQFSLTSQKQN
ncbi:hypothetical protein SNEBB_005006 [Seison nebaliae]|nr:hypothetical protein SNEBB_005006 [Seison nebaliae]